MKTRWGGASQGLGAGQTDWHTTDELLESRQYERAAEILHTAQVASEQRGDAILADTLSAARQICLACSQCRAEVVNLRRACEETDQREHELRQQLRTILDLISGHRMHETPERQDRPPSVPVVEASSPDRGTPEPVGRLGLWQRIQDLFYWGADSRAGKETPNIHPEAPTPPIVEQPGGHVLPLIGKRRQKERASPLLVAYCLGQFRVYINEKLIEKWPGHKCKSIFKYLIANREHPVHREILMDLFWRDAEPEAARRNLYQAIYSLRQALHSGGPNFSYILCRDSSYHLNPDMELWVDNEAFGIHYQTGQRLEREGRFHEAISAYGLAENLYAGEFLAEDRYEDWAIVHRENLKHIYLDILDRVSRYYFDQKQLALCITFCQKILGQDNCREDAHRRLMRCYLRQGQRFLAARQYYLCVETLKRELDVPPMPATIELYHKAQ